MKYHKKENRFPTIEMAAFIIQKHLHEKLRLAAFHSRNWQQECSSAQESFLQNKTKQSERRTREKEDHLKQIKKIEE